MSQISEWCNTPANTILLTRTIGAVALVLTVIAFLSKKHSVIMALRTAGEFIFMVQYIVLGAYTGAVMNLLGATRNLIFADRVKKGKSNLPFQITFGVLFIAGGIYTWEGPMSLLPIGSKLITTVSYGLADIYYLKLITLPNNAAFFIYNLTRGSFEGAAADIASIATILYSLTTCYWLPRLKENGKTKPFSDR